MKPSTLCLTWRRAALAALLSASFVATAQAASVRVFVEVGESGRPPIVSGSDGAGAVITDGTRRTDSAAYGTNTGAFDIAPQLGLASMSAHSGATTFPEWGGLQRETQASGLIEISDRFRVEGGITGTVAGFFVARVSGTLLPDLDFEQEFLQIRNEATYTASSRTQMTFGQRTPQGVESQHFLHDQVGSWLGAGNPCTVPCVIGTELQVEFVVPLLITDDSREFSFVLDFAGTGRRGGGFVIGGDAGAQSGSALRLGELSGDPSKALSFELQLPTGLSFVADGGHFMRLAPIDDPGGPVPEPPLPWLLAAAGTAAFVLRRRVQAGGGRG